MAAHQFFNFFGLIVDAETVDNGGACLVHADELNFGSFPTELDHYPIQRTDGGDIPKMGMTQIDDHLLQHLFEIEVLAKALGGGKEDLAFDRIAPGGTLGVQLAADQQEMGNLIGKKHRRQQHSGKDAEGQIMSENHDNDRRYHHATG